MVHFTFLSFHANGVGFIAVHHIQVGRQFVYFFIFPADRFDRDTEKPDPRDAEVDREERCAQDQWKKHPIDGHAEHIDLIEDQVHEPAGGTAERRIDPFIETACVLR